MITRGAERDAKGKENHSSGWFVLDGFMLLLPTLITSVMLLMSIYTQYEDRSITEHMAMVRRGWKTAAMVSDGSMDDLCEL